MNLPARAEPHEDRCGRKTRSGAPCKQIAGWGTDHVGAGACKLHGGKSPIKHGIFSGIRSERLREAMERHLANPDPLNVLPELAQMRAILEDFLNRYEKNSEALLAWHESWRASNRPIAEDRIQAIEVVLEELEALRGEVEEPEVRHELEPQPHGGALKRDRLEGLDQVERAVLTVRDLVDDLRRPGDDGKPRQLMDIASATVILDRIGKLVGRVEKVNREGWIPRPEFFRIMQEFARVVKESNEIADPDTRLRTIDAGWKRIFLVG